jgi:hypothetical protein
MLALNGRESDIDAFAFTLAKELGKTVAEIEDMSHAEYVGWQAYYKVQGALKGVG